VKRSLAAWLKTLEEMHPRSIDLGLDRCSEVYRNLGSPRPARRVWTVGGTNGKGSVVTYLASLLGAAGRTWGSFTSPHILRFNERICVNGVEATDELIIAAFERIEQAREGVSLTYFEFTTLAALLLLHEAQLDAAVLEVGLGGRLDAVNLVDADCAVITTIGLDHMEYLGSNREDIGREKSGIMRAGRPVVVGDPAPPSSVLQHAERVGARLLLAGRDFSIRDHGKTCQFRDAQGERELPRPILRGGHQLQNLAAALAALAAIEPELMAAPEQLASGIIAARVPGRLQSWPDDHRVILDVGHNPLAAEVVAQYLSGQPHRRVWCVLGMLADKDAEAVACLLKGQVSDWHCASLGSPRGQTGQALADRVRRCVDGRTVRGFDCVADALQQARRRAGDDDLVLVFGSFETVGAAMRALTAQPNSDALN
jgi:dihydrofolate synthase/folylpolyglutamate synthase